MADDAYQRKLANDEANRQAMIRQLEKQAQDQRRAEADRAAAQREADRQRQMSQNIKKNW